jgi:hypothetical protein
MLLQIGWSTVTLSRRPHFMCFKTSTSIRDHAILFSQLSWAQAPYHAEPLHWILRHEFDSSSEPRIDCAITWGEPFSAWIRRAVQRKGTVFILLLGTPPLFFS